MPDSNPNNLDFFNPNGEVFPFIKGKAGTSPNNFDFFNSNNEVFPAILQDDITISLAVSSPPKRRIFLID